MTRCRALLAACALLAALAACGTARRSEPLAGPLPDSSPEIARGREVFARHCHQCHPGGEAGLGPALNNKPMAEWLVKHQIRHGLGAMPAFDSTKIDDADLEALVRYMLVLRDHLPKGR